MYPPFEPTFFDAGEIILSFSSLARKTFFIPSFRLRLWVIVCPVLMFAAGLSGFDIVPGFTLIMLPVLLGPALWSAPPWFASDEGTGLSGRHRPKKGERYEMTVSREQSEPGPDISRDELDQVKCAFFDFAPVILLAVDAKGYVLTANSHFEELVRLPLSQIKGRRWFEDFVPDQERLYCLDVFRRCLDSGHEYFFESTLMDAAERKRVIRWKCGLARLDNQSVVQYCGEDVTEHESEHIELVKTVDKLNRLTEELENRVRERTRDLEATNRNLKLHLEERDLIERQLVNSERLHMAMAHNFPNGIIAVLDQHLKFLLVDGRELKLLGYPSEALVGKFIYSDELGLDRDAVESLKDAFKGDTTLVEVAFKGVFYNLTAVPLPDHENKIDKILVVFQNISQHKKLAESLYSSIDQERKLNELKSRFLSMASHEFRTPLSTILSSVFLLENYNGQFYDQHKHHHIGRIKRTINMLTEILNDFLRLGRLEEGRIKLVLSDTHVEEYVGEIVKELQTLLKPGQEIQYRYEGIDVSVLIDRNLIRGILLNLLSNASKYSPELSQICLNTSLAEEQLIISVTDKGVGIPAEEHQHVFDLFFRAVNALHVEGTGLGLHIVKKYVELMNGSVNFRSDDTGTTFTVEIPLSRTPDNTRLILR